MKEDKLVKRLEEEGARQRERDLSVNAVNATRRRVAHILADKREAEAEHGIVIPWFRSFDPMLKVAAAVIPAVLIGVLVLVLNKDDKIHPTSSELAMKNEIEELSSSLRGGLSYFRGKYQSTPQTSAFDTKRSNLKARIDRCFIELQKELAEEKFETANNMNSKVKIENT